MCSVGEDTLVQLETCGQLANVTAADVPAILDSLSATSWGISLLLGGIHIAEISPWSLPTPHKTQ